MAVVAGQFGSWTPIGTEQTAGGYEVAWKVTGSDQYIVWNTDNAGNQVSQTAIMSGSNSTLESLETSFHQDLNGDKIIGVPGGLTSGGTLDGAINSAPNNVVNPVTSAAGLPASDTFKFVDMDPNRAQNVVRQILAPAPAGSFTSGSLRMILLG